MSIDITPNTDGTSDGNFSNVTISKSLKLTGNAQNFIDVTYLIWTDGTTVNARNGKTGVIDYSGTDFGVVMNSVIGAINTGDSILIKSGNYIANTVINVNKSVHIKGEGLNTQIFQNINDNLFNITSQGNIFEKIYAASAATSSGKSLFLFTNSHRNRIRDVFATGGYYGIYFHGSLLNWVENFTERPSMFTFNAGTPSTQVTAIFTDRYNSISSNVNMYISIRIEGMGNGIDHNDTIASGQGDIWIYGGSIEGNTGFGLKITNTAKGGIVLGTDFESNTGTDITLVHCGNFTFSGVNATTMTLDVNSNYCVAINSLITTITDNGGTLTIISAGSSANIQVGGSLGVGRNPTALADIYTNAIGANSVLKIATGVAAGFPQLFLNYGGGGGDAKNWDFLAVGNALNCRAVNDANNAANNWLVISRSGFTISNLNFPNGTISIGSFINKYNNISTVGLGVPSLYAGGTVQHKTSAAPDNIAYIPPLVSGLYRVTVALLVKTATALTFKLKVTYTGVDGVAKTDVVDFEVENSATLTLTPNTADRFTAVLTLLIDASGGAITITDNAGTYTTCEYWYTAAIEQLA